MTKIAKAINYLQKNGRKFPNAYLAKKLDVSLRTLQRAITIVNKITAAERTCLKIFISQKVNIPMNFKDNANRVRKNYIPTSDIFYCENSKVISSFLKAKSFRPNIVLMYPENFQHPLAINEIVNKIIKCINKGIKVTIKTNSANILNRIRYSVFKNILSTNAIVIYYEISPNRYKEIHINPRGKYTDIEGNKIQFPSGFFDSELDELLEMV